MARLHYCPWCSEEKSCPYRSFFQDGDKPRDPRTFFQPSHVGQHSTKKYYYLRIQGLGVNHFKGIQHLFPPSYKVQLEDENRQIIVIYFGKETTKEENQNKNQCKSRCSKCDRKCYKCKHTCKHKNKVKEYAIVDQFKDPRQWKVPHLSELEEVGKNTAMPSFWKPFFRPKIGFMDFFQQGSFNYVPIDQYRELRSANMLKGENVLLFREPSALLFNPPAPKKAPVLSISAVQTVLSVAPDSVGVHDNDYIAVPKKAVRAAKQQLRAAREALHALDPYVQSALKKSTSSVSPSPAETKTRKSASEPPSPKTNEYACRKCGESSFRSRNALFDHIYSNTCQPDSRSKTQPSLIAGKNTLKVDPSGRCHGNEDIAASSTGRPASPAVQPPTPRLHDIPEWRRAPSPISPTPNLEERHRKYLEYRRARVPLPKRSRTAPVMATDALKPSRIPVLKRFAPGSITALTEAFLAEWNEATAAMPATVSPAPKILTVDKEQDEVTTTATASPAPVANADLDWKPFVPRPLPPLDLSHYKLDKKRYRIFKDDPAPVAVAATITASPAPKPVASSPSQSSSSPVITSTPDEPKETSTPGSCRTCNKSFASRNLLFAHLHEHNHHRPDKSFKIKNTSWRSGRVIQMDFGVLGDVISKLTAVASAA